VPRFLLSQRRDDCRLVGEDAGMALRDGVKGWWYGRGGGSGAPARRSQNNRLRPRLILPTCFKARTPPNSPGPTLPTLRTSLSTWRLDDTFQDGPTRTARPGWPDISALGSRSFFRKSLSPGTFMAYKHIEGIRPPVDLVRDRPV
jgi:hypothetical protein